ncbi:M23 family metallopeptidase [Naumannella sp. ID2617S]|nr:M23 family metallopeptidase [Naumannella sp. ID2617S]
MTPSTEPKPDPRWRFFSTDQTRYGSPWYAGRHRVMIGFGCTEAPYYNPDPRCPGRQGFHHGVDVAIPCGNPLYAGVSGRVVLGGLGSAYGSKAFRIRTERAEVIVGHVQRVSVSDGQRVEVGTPIGEVGDLGAPDGCHLHLEQRGVGGGVSSATDPGRVLGLAR